MIYCLIAKGPNSIKVPCLFWTDFEVAKQRCFDLLGDPSFSQKMEWMIFKEEYDKENKETNFFIYPETSFDSFPINYSERGGWHKIQENNPNKKVVKSSMFFTSYYGGCGEINSFELKAIEEDTPSVPFNLD